MQIRVCPLCGITYAVPDTFIKERIEDHNSFYCPNGHGRYFYGKSEVEKLQDELAQEKRKSADLQQKLIGASTPRKRGRPRKTA